jgi:hypothetical protein
MRNGLIKSKSGLLSNQIKPCPGTSQQKLLAILSHSGGWLGRSLPISSFVVRRDKLPEARFSICMQDDVFNVVDAHVYLPMR